MSMDRVKKFKAQNVVKSMGFVPHPAEACTTRLNEWGTKKRWYSVLVHLVLRSEYSLNRCCCYAIFDFWNFNCCRQNRKNEIEKEISKGERSEFIYTVYFYLDLKTDKQMKPKRRILFAKSQVNVLHILKSYKGQISPSTQKVSILGIKN